MRIPMFGDYGPVGTRMRRRGLMRLGALGRKNPMGMSPHALMRSGRNRAIGGGVGIGGAAMWGRSSGSSGLNPKSSGSMGVPPSQDPYGSPGMY